jgi:beta-lactamase class A
MSVTWAVDRGRGPVGPGADVQVAAASTIKIVVATCLWGEVERGGLDADAPAPPVPVVGDGALLDVLPGLELTLAHLCTLMLAVSDNAATNALLELLGIEAVNAEAERLGLQATRVARAMHDADAIAAGRDNLTSAGDLAHACRVLADPLQVSRRVAWRVLEGLRASQHLDILGEICPPDRLLACKRGFNERASHDCGLVETQSGPVGVAVCSSPPAAPDALREAARRALATVDVP